METMETMETEQVTNDPAVTVETSNIPTKLVGRSSLIQQIMNVKNAEEQGIEDQSAPRERRRNTTIQTERTERL